MGLIYETTDAPSVKTVDIGKGLKYRNKGEISCVERG